jgi:hypothetical protein
MMRIDKKQQLNRVRGWNLIFLMIFFTLPFWVACAGPEPGESDDDNQNIDFEITDISYLIFNVDENSDFLSDTDPNIRSFYEFSLDYKGEDPDLETLEVNIRFYGIYEWNLDNFTDAEVDIENKKIIIPYLHPWDNRYKYDWPPNVLPLGEAIFEVELDPDHKLEYTKIITGPGEEDTTNYEFIYTEDVSQMPSANSVSMIPRATITQRAVKDANGITIYFAADHNQVRNGLILFYDTNGRPIAHSEMFVDGEGNENDILNDGAPLNTNDYENIVNLSASDLISPDEATVTLDEIVYYTIQLTDKIESINDSCVSFTDRFPF